MIDFVWFKNTNSLFNYWITNERLPFIYLLHSDF